MKSFVRLLLFAALPLWAELPTVGVLPFNVSPSFDTSELSNQTLDVEGFRSDLLSSDILHELALTQKFQIKDLSVVLDRPATAYSTKALFELAQVHQCDYLVLGEIDQLSIIKSAKKIAYAESFTKVRYHASFGLKLRFIRLKNQKVGKVANLHLKKTYGEHFSPQEIFYLLRQEAGKKIVQQLMNRIYPIRVAKTDGNFIYLNRGKDSGLEIGNRLQVYIPGIDLVDIDIGQRIGAIKEIIAEIKITECEDRFAKALVIRSRETIPENAYCFVVPSS